MTEADETAERKAQDISLAGGDFRLFVQKLGYQALLSMGVLENPITHTKDVRLEQARSVIDDLMMLRDKCHGNLDEDEQKHLATVIGNLQQHYVRLSGEAEAEQG